MYIAIIMHSFPQECSTYYGVDCTNSAALAYSGVRPLSRMAAAVST